MPRMTRKTAEGILTRCHLSETPNFFTLSDNDKEDLLREADAVKYRKPKSANGSRARYFYAYVLRAANKEEA
jgi:hypothetical protein